MSKYNVELKFWKFVYDVEAENEQEAIKNAFINIIKPPNLQHVLLPQLYFFD